MRQIAQTTALAVSFVLVLTVATFAQDTTVTLPWGDWVDAILGQVLLVAGTVVSLIVAFALRLLPPAIRAFVDQQRINQVEQLLTAAIGYGINAVQGAAKGKELSLNVGNEVAAEALQYAVDHGPGWLIGWMGGVEAVREKIIARLPLDADAGLK